MRIWIDEDFQQVRRETDSCIDGVCNVFFDYVAAGTPAPPMLVPHRELADFTWTEEDLRHAATSNASANSVALSRYGTLASRPAGWAWTGWQGTIEYDNQSRPSRIDLTTIMPRTGTPGAWKGTLTRTESPEHWALANGTRHLWAINPNAATPWFPGFDDPVPSRDFTLAEAHQQVLDEYPEAQQANDAACTVKVALGLVDGANSTVTPFDLGSDFFEAQDTLVSFGFPQDDGIAIWAVLRSEADHVRPARYEEGGTAFLLGASPRCDEFGTRAGAVSFYDLAAWAQLAVHGRTADSVHVSWHDTTYHGRLVTGTHLTTSFGPVDPEASVSASFAVVYSPNTARLGGGLMPASWVQALDAGKIPQPTIV